MRRRLPAASIGFGAIACAGVPHSTGVPEYGISPDSLRQHLEEFSADSMLGRSFLGPGHDRATRYLAGAARRAGLEPAGENGGWFQTLHMYSRRLTDESRIVVGDTVLAPARDFKLLSAGVGRPRSIAGARVVYGGVAGDSATQISAEDAVSRVVLLSAPADMSPEMVYRNVGLPASTRFVRAAAVAIASLDYLAPSQRIIVPAIGPLDASTPRADAQPATWLVTRAAAALLMGRTLDGVRAGALGRIVDERLSMEERDIPTRNVVGVLRGRDDALARTYVALGAHSDHLGVGLAGVDHDSVRAAALLARRSGSSVAAARIATLRDSLMHGRPPRRDSIYNGADDDGSGSVALLEIARALTSGVHPRRSVLFVWHAAEESELAGSDYFLQHPTVPRDSIVAQINLDMVGRGGAQDIEGGGPRFLQVIGSTRSSPDLWPLIDSVNVYARLPLALDTVDHEGGFCRSDQLSYARLGIPVAFLTTGSHADYHAVTDEAEYVDYAKLATVSRFTADVVRALADRAEPLRRSSSSRNPRRLCGG